MKLLFKQRLFSWFDSYDIYNEDQQTVYTVQGRLAWGHKLEVSDATGRHIATLQQEIFTFLPKFYIYINNQLVGEIIKELTLFRPSFSVNCNGWQVDGSIFEWDYRIKNASGSLVATAEKQLFNFTDTYVIDVFDPNDSLLALMVVLAIDAVKCSQK